MESFNFSYSKYSEIHFSRLPIYFSLILLCLIFTYSCNQSFEPIKENDKYNFSMYGYLDASADTQWVRITPARDQVNQPPVKPEMQVMLENLQNSSTTVLNDSLFQFTNPSGFNVINAWTTTDIAPSQTYRLHAKRPDGRESEVTITLPEKFPNPSLIPQPGNECNGTLRIEGVKNLADVHARWQIKAKFINEGRVIFEQEEFFIFPYMRFVNQLSSNEYEVFIDTERELGFRNSGALAPPGTVTEIDVISREIFVASGGPEWNSEIDSISNIEYSLPQVFSNVENGLGYMVGIVSKKIPFIPDNDCIN